MGVHGMVRIARLEVAVRAGPRKRIVCWLDKYSFCHSMRATACVTSIYLKLHYSHTGCLAVGYFFLLSRASLFVPNTLGRHIASIIGVSVFIKSMAM